MSRRNAGSAPRRATPAGRANRGWDANEAAVVAVDESGRVLIWNAAAERLLGPAASVAIGRRCHEVIAARDLFGNLICYENCPVQAMARQGERIRPFEWTAYPAAEASGRAARVSVSKVRVHRNGYALVHVLHAKSSAHETRAMGIAGRAGLSARESQVFVAVARGLRTREIAAELGIALATARNHVQKVIEKLGVRSKLEAVALVIRGRFEGRGTSAD
jgi:DNA-binding CsgD family transcriptional regulator